MQTKTIVQSSCNVIRITSLVKGNTYKRVDDSYGTKVKYGVVLDLFNTGEKTFIQALEYEPNYSSITAEIKVFKGDEDLAIFPATMDELKEHFASSLSSLRKRIEDKKKELADAELGLQRAEAFLNGEQQKQLSETSFEEITQAQFDGLQKQIA